MVYDCLYLLLIKYRYIEFSVYKAMDDTNIWKHVKKIGTILKIMNPTKTSNHVDAYLV